LIQQTGPLERQTGEDKNMSGDLYNPKT